MKPWVSALGWLLFALTLGALVWIYAGGRADMRQAEQIDQARVERISALVDGMEAAEARAAAHKARADRIQAEGLARLKVAEDAAQALRRRIAERPEPKSLKECQDQLGQCDDHAESLAEGFSLEKATRLALEDALRECDRAVGYCTEALGLQGDRAEDWKKATRKEIKRRRWKVAGATLAGAAGGFALGFGLGATR